MYLWKCWRDSRTHFISSLVAVTVICIVSTIVALKIADIDAARRSPAETWATGEVFLGSWIPFFTLLWALILGASGVGEEFKEKTADFLLVRPRRRRYWVWTGWLLGAGEIAAMVFVAVAATFATLIYVTGGVQSWRSLATVPPLALGGTVVYGLTYFMTLVARNGRQGLSLGLGILILNLLLPAALEFYWKTDFHYSILGFMMAACKTFVGMPGAFPAGSLAFWIAVAFAFPLAAQLLLERAEV